MANTLAFRLPAGETVRLRIEEPISDKNIIRAVEEQWPGLWAKCYPRVYDDARLGGFYSPRLLAGQMAGNVIGRGLVLIHAGVANFRQFHYHWPYTPHHADPEQLSFKVIHLGDLEGAMSKGSDDTSNFFFPEGMTDEDHLFVRKVAHYVFSSIMLMLARPELVERGTLRKRVEKPGKPTREFWTPNIMGGRYRVAQERVSAATQAGSHASPRAHWRRGHWRQQAYGEGRSQRRDLWIEPILVNAGE